MSEKTIFKKIIDGEVPSYKIYEDEDFFVFLDIFPRAPGHTLIIPKKEFRWVWDVDKYSEYMNLVRRIARAQQKVFHTDMIRMEIYGEEVSHAHIKIWPQVPNNGIEKNFKEIAEKIKKEL